MDSGETVTCCHLEGVSCVRASLRVPFAFGGGAGCEVDASHVFSYGLLAAVTLEVDGAGDRGARASAGYEAVLPYSGTARGQV